MLVYFFQSLLKITRSFSIILNDRMTQYSNRSFYMVIADFSEFCPESFSMMILFKKKKQINKQTELRKKESRNGIEIDTERRILAPRFGSSANLIFIKFIWHLATKTISTITFCGRIFDIFMIYGIWFQITFSQKTLLSVRSIHRRCSVKKFS